MVYTDGIHLTADKLYELHAFAGRIGLTRKHFIDHKHQHYGLIGNMVNKALLEGAKLRDTRFLVRNSLSKQLKIKPRVAGIILW